MSEDGEMWEAHKKERQQKRWHNHHSSLRILTQHGIEFKVLNEAVSHCRVGEYDFWPTTGTFLHRDTGAKGRGVFNLIKLLK